MSRKRLRSFTEYTSSCGLQQLSLSFLNCRNFLQTSLQINSKMSFGEAKDAEADLAKDGAEEI